MTDAKNRYTKIIEAVFAKRYRPGATDVEFERSDIAQAARDLGIELPKNLGDVVYSYRYRTDLPDSVTEKAAPGRKWIIRPAGQARYRFVLTAVASLEPSPMLAETKVPDSTPGVISMYSMSDEQALLARIRYNRLVDVLTGLTCYSLQNHLRTTAPGIGQVETDELYIGLDRRGVHYVLPVQAKGGRDKMGVVQIEQDLAVCAAKFPALPCRPVAAQFIEDDLIAMFELEHGKDGIRVSAEKHYRLVRPEDLSTEELDCYQRRPL